MLHLSRTPHGGLAVGVGAFGSALWAQREPRCHRWHLWRTQAPSAVGPCGDDWGFDTDGVREPRRPRPGFDSDGIALDPPPHS